MNAGVGIRTILFVVRNDSVKIVKMKIGIY